MQQKLDVMVPTRENKNTTIITRYTAGTYVVLLKLCIYILYYGQILKMIISSYIEEQRKKKTKSVKLSHARSMELILIHHSKN
jgi:hypothetical protein